MRPVLTENAIRAAQPNTTLWDGSVSHFGLRVSQGGTKTFILLLGSGRRRAIGRYPTITLAQARQKARLLLAERTLGRFQPQTITWDAALALYLAFVEKKNRPRTHREYARALKRYFPFRGLRLGDITRADIAHSLDRLASTLAQQGRAHAYCKTFFNWAMRRGYIDRNPCIMPAMRFRSRERVLSDDEIKLIWRACEQAEERHSPNGADGERGELPLPKAVSLRLPVQFTTIIKLLILTGQRRGEIAALQSSWLNGSILTLPGSATKNGREHAFPLGDSALAILNPLREKQSLLFPARGKSSPFNGWSNAKSALDELSGVSDWTLHDIRRTFATRLAELGVAPHVIERLLNHATGTLSPIARVYNRASYMDEMRRAVGAWEDHLAKLRGAP